MPYRKIEFRAGEHYHLYNRGNNFQAIYFERENYLYFLRLLREHITEVAEVIAYCLMPNHYHLLARLLMDDLSTAMQSFALAYTKAVSKRYGRVGSLFQGPFKAVHVDLDEYLLHLSRYAHLNPVTARLVKQAEDWEFSSYREYLGLRDGSLPNPEIVLSRFPSPDAYRAFVEAYGERDQKLIEKLMLD